MMEENTSLYITYIYFLSQKIFLFLILILKKYIIKNTENFWFMDPVSLVFQQMKVYPKHPLI